jgi:peptidoglycan/LPS O-acetylase OafA/YrhL
MFFAGAPANPWLGPLSYPLESGVTVFLVISGFLLYRPFVRAHITDEPPPASWPYAARRFMRIVPAFWVALVISALVFSWGYVFSLDGIVKYFSVGQVYFSLPLDKTAIAPAWTLGLEISFYIFLPIWAWLLRRLHRGTGRSALRFHWLSVAGLAGFGLVYKAIIVASGARHGITPVGDVLFATLPAYIDDFAIGMALALIVIGDETRTAPRPRIATTISERPWLAWGAALAAYVLAIWLVRPDTGPLFSNGEYAWRILLYAIIGFGLVAPAALGMAKESLINRFLSTRLLVSAGLVSYGIYLWHWSAIVWLSQHYPTVNINKYVIWVTVPVAITLVLATLSYLLIERPSIKFARRAGGSYKGEVDPPPVVPLGEEGLAGSAP